MQGGTRVGDLGRHSVNLDVSAFRLRKPCQHTEQVALALPVQRGDADDLALPDIEGYVAQDPAREPPDAERNRRVVADRRLRVDGFARAAATIISKIFSSEAPESSTVPMLRPLRRIVARAHMARTSPSRWEM